MRRVGYSLLLLALFTTYQVGILMFTHVHCINGVMLVHAHPAKKNHDHTKGQCLLIDRLATFHSVEPADLPLLKPSFLLLAHRETSAPDCVAMSREVSTPSLRAPPVAL